MSLIDMMPLGLPPVFHGSDEAALKDARRRARMLGGVVVWSAPPGTKLDAPAHLWGYWSEPSGAYMIREAFGERIVGPKDSR